MAETELNKAIGEELANRRIAAGLSQEELAAICGIHRTYVSQLERGLKSPTVQTVFHLAEGLGVSASRFLASVEKRIR